MQVGKDGGHVAGCLQIVDVELAEERLVEESAHLVGSVSVQLVRVDDEVERMPEDSRADGQLLAGVDQTGFDAFALLPDLLHLGSDPCLGQETVGERIDEPVLLFVQFLQLSIEGGVTLASRGLLVCEHFIEEFSDLVTESVGELKRSIMVDDRLFDHVDWQVGQIACAVLLAPADEVGIAYAAAAGGLAVYKPGHLACVPAAPALKKALQVVVMDPIPIAVGASSLECVLDALE